MNKYYITFDQIHVHSINGKTIDKDCLVELEAETHREAHEKAMKLFDSVFKKENVKQCKCRIYGKDSPDGGAMTVRMKDGKAYCPRCGEHINYEKGNYEK